MEYRILNIEYGIQNMEYRIQNIENKSIMKGAEEKV